MAQYVSRDSYARETLYRESVDGTCDWCGNKDGRGKVGRYYIETDIGRRYDIKGTFCSKQCMRSYHE